MGLRFQRRIGILKGLTRNLSKHGKYWTLGGRGASVNLKDGYATGNVDTPGTGLSYRERRGNADSNGSDKGGGAAWVLWQVIGIVLHGAFLEHR